MRADIKSLPPSSSSTNNTISQVPTNIIMSHHYPTPSHVYRPLHSISDNDLHHGVLVNPARYIAPHPLREPHPDARPISKRGPWATADQILHSPRHRHNPSPLPQRHSTLSILGSLRGWRIGQKTGR
ncbi:hypothetical protein CPB85DRAFT_1330386 [Mucidula mucida]|nr:hypothetical protein CPB85DRAFT_1330386 [Mucidula mucida]